MLLYAALTSHWPGPDCPTLPPAPVADGLPCSPRQVRAGVPAPLDEITSQVLVLRDRDGGPALTTPAQLAAALLAAIPPVPIPQLPPSTRARSDGHRASPRTARGPEYPSPEGREPEYWSPDGRGETEHWSPDGRGVRGRPRARPPGPRAGASRAVVIAVVAAVVAAGLAWTAYHSLRGSGPAPRTSPTQHQGTAPRGTGSVATLTPVGATGFNDNRQDSGLAIDNNPSTFWATSYYIDDPVFGGLKKGAGLILDMGKPVRLSSVTVTFGSVPGANVDIKIGNSNAQGPPDGSDAQGQQTADAMSTVASQTNVSATVTFTVSSHATGQYVLIWFTKLPPYAGHPNQYLAKIFNVVVKGSG
jgi:hypothetical protein